MSRRARLPAPLVPSDCDLRDVPLPRDLFVKMAMETFGFSLLEAEAMVGAAIERHERGKESSAKIDAK